MYNLQQVLAALQRGVYLPLSTPHDIREALQEWKDASETVVFDSNRYHLINTHLNFYKVDYMELLLELHTPAEDDKE